MILERVVGTSVVHKMSDMDELEDELLQVAGRPRQGAGSKRARRTAADDSDEADLSDVKFITFKNPSLLNPPPPPPPAQLPIVWDVHTFPIFSE